MSQSKTLDGVLLKIEFTSDLIGYCSLHPHPELGDLKLNEQLTLLKLGMPTSLAQNSIHWAFIDAHARRQQTSVFSGLNALKTHFVATQIEELRHQLETLQTQGFTHFKVKMGRDLPSETKILQEILPLLGKQGLRLDFNEALSEKVFFKWCEEMKMKWDDCLDYIEDPMPFESKIWSRSDLPLALDRDLNLENLKNFTHKTIIFKTAVSDLLWLSRMNKRVIFSTYMDHPLGEMSALYAAAHYYQVDIPHEVCGLRTWHLFEKNEFSEQLGVAGPDLVFPSGTGFGFDESLKTLNWSNLS